MFSGLQLILLVMFHFLSSQIYPLDQKGSRINHINHKCSLKLKSFLPSWAMVTLLYFQWTINNCPSSSQSADTIGPKILNRDCSSSLKKISDFLTLLRDISLHFEVRMIHYFFNPMKPLQQTQKLALILAWKTQNFLCIP